MPPHQLAALAAAGVLAIAHIGAARFTFLREVPRHAALSAAGGVSVAYVFVHLLPEVAEAQEAISEATAGVLPAIERHAYLIALVGLAIFYGVEQMSVRSRRRRAARDQAIPVAERQPADGGVATEPGAFALSVGSFAVYNGLIGYLLVERAEEHGWANLMLFSFAMGVHFVGNDVGLSEHHRHRYQTWGRWLLSAAVLVGWALGARTEISEAAVAVVVAFLAGGIVLNVLKEELPEDRESNVGAFVAGAGGYAALLLAL